jgi:hypothetical protein
MYSQTKGRGLYEPNYLGASFGNGHTLALVYQYFTAGGNTPYPHSWVVGDKLNAITLGGRYGVFGYSWQVGGSVSSGYFMGTQVAPNQKSATGFVNSLVNIVVISNSGFVQNGGIVTPVVNNLTNGGLLSSVGGSGDANSGGVFKLAEALVWSVDFNDLECLDICTALNNKYAIY